MKEDMLIHNKELFWGLENIYEKELLVMKEIVLDYKHICLEL